MSWYNTAEQDKKHNYARKMIHELKDVALLRLFEAFLESGPQLILLIYFLLQRQTSNYFDLTAVGKTIKAFIEVSLMYFNLKVLRQIPLPKQQVTIF